MAEQHAVHKKHERAPGSNRRDAKGRLVRPSIWVSLSGGGFRAAIFHYGCLKRLRELGLLGHVYAFSGASGGSIIASLLHAHCKGPASDVHENEGLDEYDWDGFERSFLRLVKQGLFAPVMQLLISLFLYWLGATMFGESWYLIRPHAMFAGWTGLPEVLWVAARDLSVCIFLGGLALHSSMAITLVREGALRPSAWAVRMAGVDDDFAEAEWARGSVLRLLRMLLRPAYLRRQLLNLRAFHGTLLKGIRSQPKLFLTAVDLNAGRETVFTSGLFADLSEKGCQYLWDQRAEGDANSTGSVELAQAVSASSAFAPIFRPVAIRNQRGIVGVFVDGGVLDYFALNVPRSFGIRMGAGEPRGAGRPSFRDEISFVLGLDGCKASLVWAKRHWSRGATVLRMKQVMVDQTFDAVELFAEEFDRDLGIRTGIAGLEFGFPPECPLHDADLNKSLAHVRTHLDSFSLEETAAIAYCGYLQADRAVAAEMRTGEYQGARPVPLAPFEQILPAYCGPWKTSLAELKKHLRYSNRRELLLRKCGRICGL
jgi:predicted acylesterase/phospholipase RssA